MPDPKETAYQEHVQQFDNHVKHFEQIDPLLERFAAAQHFVLEKNQWHRPCRVLRRKGKPEYVVEISQEGDWKKVTYRDDLPHTFIAAAYVRDSEAGFVYQKNEEIAYFLHFSTITVNLEEYLKKAMACIEQWTAEVIVQEGAKSKDPMAYYREQGGIKLQTVD